MIVRADLSGQVVETSTVTDMDTTGINRALTAVGAPMTGIGIPIFTAPNDTGIGTDRTGAMVGDQYVLE